MSRSWKNLAVLFAVLVVSTALGLRAAMAEAFNWYNVPNWMTSVKDQWGGTCWAHAACGTLEAKYKLTRNDPYFNPNLSEQQLCWVGQGDGYSTDLGGPDGGWAHLVFTYSTSHSVVSQTECPHQPSCDDIAAPGYYPLASGWENRGWRSKWGTVSACAADTITIKQWLKQYGPMSVGVHASSDFGALDDDLYESQFNLKHFYDGPGGDLTHEVVLVGYYDDAEMPTGGCWVVKNSWGSDWGNGGYGYVPYGHIEYHDDIYAIKGAVYYTGAMVEATWKGGSGTWSSGGDNWSAVDQSGTTIPTYTWENQETSATFDASTGTNITLSGTVIAHGLTINSGATGYVFSGGALTITRGGITARESVTINAPVTIGAPQTWTVDSGKLLTIDGAVHTVISDLTIGGAGDTTVTGPIDGGGLLNSLGAAPGNLNKSGAGTLTLTGPSDYNGTITVTGGTLTFAPPAGVFATFSGPIGGGGAIRKADAGTVILSHSGNSYSGTTTISAGALQADNGVGLPSASNLILDGGVLQSNGPATFARSLGTTAGRFGWTENGGGFAAGPGAMTVNISSGAIIAWGTTIGTNLVGTLKFGSPTAANVVTFQNPINLSGDAGATTRTIHVDDNPAATTD